MTKLFWMLLVLLVSAPAGAWGADYYVRPPGGSYGAENGTSYANAFDGFSDVAGLAAGDTLYVCDSPFVTTQTLIVDTYGNGTDASRIVVSGACPNNPPSTPITEITCSSVDYPFFHQFKDYWTYQDLDISGCNYAIYFYEQAVSTLSHVIVQRVNAHDIALYAMSYKAPDDVDAPVRGYNITFRNNTFTTIGWAGIQVYGEVDGVYIHDNTFTDISETGDTWAVQVTPQFLFIQDSSWTLDSGTIYHRSLTGNWSGKTLQDVGGVAVAVSFLTQVAPPSPASGQWAQDGDTIYINIGESPQGDAIVFTGSNVENVYIYNNIVNHVTRPGGGSEGNGLGCHNYVLHCEIYANTIDRAGQSGVFLELCVSCAAMGNVVTNSGYYGVQSLSSSNALFANNTCGSGIAQGCVSFQYSTGVVVNTAMSGSGVGLISTGSTLSEYTNLIDQTSGWSGATNIASAPVFLSSTDYRLTPTSPGKRAGRSGYLCRDNRNRACYPDRPDIGAYQSTSGDPANTRAAR